MRKKSQSIPNIWYALFDEGKEEEESIKENFYFKLHFFNHKNCTIFALTYPPRI